MEPVRRRRRGPGFVACLALLGTFVIENHCSLPVFEAQQRVDHLGLAHYYLRAGLPERALTEAERALREDTDRVATLVVMARAYRQQGETEEAVEVLADAIRHDPKDGSLFMLLHQICFEAGRPGLAVAEFEHLYETSADNWNVRMALGLAYESSSNSTDTEHTAGLLVDRAARGLELLEGAVAEANGATGEDLTFARRQLARAYLRRDRAEDAAEILESSLEVDPNDRFALLTLGECRLGQGRAEEAEDLFDRLLAETDNAAAMASRLAGLWYDAGHRLQAIRYYEWAMAEESPPASLLNNLAWTYAEEDMALERAQELSLRAVKEDADNIVFLDTYAEVLYRQGRQHRAAALIRRAVELEPEDGEHHDYLVRQLHRFSTTTGFVAPTPPTSNE